MPHYSDANFTMRLSYGQVGGFDLGGSIQYDGAPGGGTRVTVAFPKNHKPSV